VDVSRLDTLMEQIGELVINRNHIGQISKTLAEKYQDDEMIRTLADSVSATGKIVNILQQDIMTIRMLPIELVFNTMPRMVRDLARKIGKKIDFIVEGQETEVDRSVIEHLRDPLIHLLRNSVDHGIESPEERQAAGKPEMGTIHLSAHHEQDHIVITVSDDGRGIDPEAVKAASVRKGVISPEAAARMTDTELMNLIMASGVSTAKTITEVSGRGVGLDIVKKNIEFLNGKITVESIIGKGSTFTLQLPLTLAIIPTLLVSLGKTVYAIPLATIVEAIKLESKQFKTVRGKEVTLYRNRVLPLLRLNNIFKWNSTNTGTSVLNHIVVVKACEMQVGIIVDELIGQQEIVVKSLDQFIGGADGLSGASILGDGQVVLILDVNSLVKSTIAESQNGKEDKEQNSLPALAAAR
jgi:two-component system chemotaxis sensor kinase CheA